VSTLSSRRRESAFTLIELLVALAIFAILSAFAYRSLATLLESRAALEQESRKWRDVALFVGRFERDLSSVLNRRSMGASGTAMAPVSSVIDLGGTVVEGLAVTRSGATLYASALAAPQRIAYRSVDDRIERLAWNAVDAAPRAEPTATPILAGARKLSFRFLDPKGEWRLQWGQPGSSDLVPAAVEVTLELASGERITRLVDLPR
jgi:general secretion pathway protein J